MRAARIRTAVAATILGGATLVGIVVAQPAQAATPCGGASNVVRSNLVFSLPTTSNGSGNFNCSLAIGDHGAGVSALQASMRACDNQVSLKVDGSFGPLTRQALRNTQALVHAGVDGLYGPETRSKMNWQAEVGSTAHFVCTKFPG